MRGFKLLKLYRVRSLGIFTPFGKKPNGLNFMQVPYEVKHDKVVLQLLISNQQRKGFSSSSGNQKPASYFELFRLFFEPHNQVPLDLMKPTTKRRRQPLMESKPLIKFEKISYPRKTCPLISSLWP